MSIIKEEIRVEVLRVVGRFKGGQKKKWQYIFGRGGRPKDVVPRTVIDLIRERAPFSFAFLILPFVLPPFLLYNFLFLYTLFYIFLCSLIIHSRAPYTHALSLSSTTVFSCSRLLPAPSSPRANHHFQFSVGNISGARNVRHFKYKKTTGGILFPQNRRIVRGEGNYLVVLHQ